DPLGHPQPAGHRAVEALLHQDLLALAVLRVPLGRDRQHVALQAQADGVGGDAGDVEAHDELLAAARDVDGHAGAPTRAEDLVRQAVELRQERVSTHEHRTSPFSGLGGPALRACASKYKKLTTHIASL